MAPPVVDPPTSPPNPTTPRDTHNLDLVIRFHALPPVVCDLLASRAPQGLAYEVAGDTEEPGPSVPAFGIEPLAMLERPPEDVTSNVLSTSDSDSTNAEPGDRIEVTIEDRAERLWLAH